MILSTHSICLFLSNRLGLARHLMESLFVGEGGTDKMFMFGPRQLVQLLIKGI